MVGAFPFARTHCKGERPHEVRYAPPRLLARCGLARGTAHLGAPGWAGEKAAFLSIQRARRVFPQLAGRVNRVSASHYDSPGSQ
jgi:hypothetical protein